MLPRLRKYYNNIGRLYKDGSTAEPRPIDLRQDCGGLNWDGARNHRNAGFFAISTARLQVQDRVRVGMLIVRPLIVSPMKETAEVRRHRPIWRCLTLGLVIILSGMRRCGCKSRAVGCTGLACASCNEPFESVDQQRHLVIGIEFRASGMIECLAR
jgi:hypothetical protein